MILIYDDTDDNDIDTDDADDSDIDRNSSSTYSRWW